MNKLFNPNKLLLQELKDIAYATPRPVRWAMVWFLLWICLLYTSDAADE